MIKKLGLIKDEEEEKIKLGSQFGGGWGISNLVKETEEDKFQKAYKEMAKKWGLNPNPYAPEHYYDYKTLWKETGRLEPDTTGHFPSKYKLEGHPRTMVNGINTVTGERGSLAKQKEEDILKPPKIKKLGLIKEKPKEPIDLGIQGEMTEDFSLPINRIKYYDSKIKWLEDTAEKKGGLGGSGYDAYEYAIEQYNKAVNEYNEELKKIEQAPEAIPGFEKVEDTKLLAYEEPKKDILGKIKEKISGVFKAKPEAQIAKAQVSYNLSQKTGIPITEIEENLDKYTKALGIRGIPTSEEYLTAMFVFPITAAIISNPISAGIGITKFLALSEAENLIISKAKGWEYQFGAGKGLKELTPEDTNQITKDILDIVDIVAKGAIVRATDKGTKAMWKKFSKEVIETYSPSKKVYLSGEKIRNLHRNDPTLYTQLEKDVYRDLPGKTEAVRTAFKQGGIDIEIPAQTITKIADRPYWAKIKGLFNIKPYSKTIISNIKGKWTVHTAGLLPEPVTELGAGMTPKDVIKSVKEVGMISQDVAIAIRNMKAEEFLEIAKGLGFAPEKFTQLIIEKAEGLEAKREMLKSLEAKREDVALEDKREMLRKQGIRDESLLANDEWVKKAFTTKVPKGISAKLTLEQLKVQRLRRTEIVPIKETEKVSELPEYLRREIREPTKEELAKLEAKKPLTAKEKFMTKIEEARAERLKKAEKPLLEKEVTVDLEEEGKVETLWAGEEIGGTSEEITEGTKKAFDKTSDFLYNKPFEDLNKSELNKVLETSKQPLPDPTGKYISKIGTPAKGLTLRPTADDQARFIFGGFEKGLLTDSHLLVLDKEVSKKILSDLIEKYKRARIKEVQTQTEEISYKEAQKMVDKEVEHYKKEFVKNFPEVDKILPENAIEKSTPLWIQGHQKTSDYTPTVTIFTDGKIQIAIDTDKVAFLNKQFPSAEIKATGVDKPVLFIEGRTLKAVVMPVRREGDFPFKITGEPTIKPAKEIPPGVKVEPTIKKLAKIKPEPTIKPTISPEEIAERGRLIKFIHTVKSVKGLSDKDYLGIKQRIKAKFKIPWVTLTRMNVEQLQAVSKSMERTRPKIIRFQKVITLKTENKIQSLKDNLIDKLQMTEGVYKNVLKDVGVYKEPKYIDGKNFITEQKGKEIIYRLINEANILRETLPYAKAVNELPNIKRLVDKENLTIKRDRDKDLKDPWEFNSMRVFAQKMEEITGAPVYRIYQGLIDISLENKEDLGIFIREFKEFKNFLKDKEALKKVTDYIVCKSNLKGKPEYPSDITNQEIKMAKKIEEILKDYRVRARTEKFLDNIEDLKAMPQYLEYKKDIDKAKDIYESKGYDDLVKYMETQKWGIVKNGYDPMQVVSPKLRLYKPTAQTFGDHNIKNRTDIEYKEQDINILERLFSYKRSMDNLVRMRPQVRALMTLVDENLDNFKNPKRVKEVIEVFLRELKGYNKPEGLVERNLNRVYAQAMQVIIMPSLAMFGRNCLQNMALGYDKTIIIDPRNKKLSTDRVDYMNTYSSQIQAMKVDWFMIGEEPYGGKIGKALMRLVNKVGIYPYSDQGNRHLGFWAKINQIDRAFKGIDKNSTEKQISKAMRGAKFDDIERTERIMALEILAKDGYEAMARYVARCYVADTEFQYNRAERSPAEMGRGKWLSNLFLFPRAYWEMLLKQGNHFKTGNMRQKARAFKVLASIIVGGLIVGEGYKKVTGRRQNPYNPLKLLAYEPGGLAIGTVEALSDVYTNTILALNGSERAMAALTTAVPNLSDMLIPFYAYTLRAIEATLPMTYRGQAVNKNIDVLALRELRRMATEKMREIGWNVEGYAPNPRGYHVERNFYQKWQYILAGAGIDQVIKEQERKEKEVEPIEIGKPKIPKLGIPTIGKPGIKKLSPIKKF